MARNSRSLTSFELQVQQAIGDGRNLGCADDPAAAKYPQLWQWLSTVYVGRDSIKTPAVLTVRLGPTGVLISLVDKDLSVSCETCCQTLETIFDAIEGALCSPTAPIKSWGRKEPHLRRRSSH